MPRTAPWLERKGNGRSVRPSSLLGRSGPESFGVCRRRSDTQRRGLGGTVAPSTRHRARTPSSGLPLFLQGTAPPPRAPVTEAPGVYAPNAPTRRERRPSPPVQSLPTEGGSFRRPGWMLGVSTDTRLGVATTQGSAVAAMCVQLVDASDNLAIHMLTRILLRSSSTHEPSDPLLEVVFGSRPWPHGPGHSSFGECLGF